MINIFRGKKILVAGGTGLVGQQLVPKLINFGAKVFVASLDDKSLVNHKIENFYIIFWFLKNMKRVQLLKLLNSTVHIVAKRNEIRIQTTEKPAKYHKYVTDMFNFLKHPEYHYLKKKG